MQRPHLVARAAAVLALTAGCWTGVQGSDDAKPSWSARLWPWSTAKVPEAKKDAKGKPVDDNKTDMDAARRLHVELDWKRRSEICQKLRQIAYETKDEELDRFAERLDQRAWDVYVRRLGNIGAGVDEGLIGARIGLDFNLLSPGPKTLPESSSAREERP